MFLDKRKPWTFVTGREPIIYQQFGRYFLRSGAPAEDEGIAPPDEPVAPVESIAAIVEAPEPVAAAVQPRPGPGRPTREEQAKIEILKVQMANYGEPWKGVDHARKYLGIA